MSLVVIFICVVAVCCFVQRNYKRFLLGSSLAGPWALPLLGNLQMIGKLKPEFIFLVFTELRETFGETYRLWLGPQLWVFLHSAEETHDALHDATLLKADTFNQLDVLIGNGLLISRGRHWETHRRALAPAFHPQVLRSFVPAIAQHADTLVEKLARNKGVAVEVSDYLFPCILDAIVETSMGRNLRTQLEAYSKYTHAFHEASELLFKRMINPLLAADWIFKRTPHWRRLNASLTVIHTLMESVINARRVYLLQEQSSLAHAAAAAAASGGKPALAASDYGAKKRLTLLDTLLTAQIDGYALSLQEIRDEVNTFVFAGVDTTAAAMNFICYALAKFPDVQTLVAQEVAATPPTAALDLDALQQLEYLDMFVKECLRFYTIVPTTGRQTTCDTRIGSRAYCAGVTLWLNLYGLAHDARYFAQPYEFRPERFAAYGAHGAHEPVVPYSYLPFSGGPHVCIGRKYSLLIIKILCVKIVRHFRLELLRPDEDLVLQAQMVLKSMHGIHVKFLTKTQ